MFNSVILLLLNPYCCYFILYYCCNYFITVLILSLLCFYNVTVFTLIKCKQLEIKHAINFLYFFGVFAKLWLLHVTSVTWSVTPVTEASCPSHMNKIVTYDCCMWPLHKTVTRDDRNNPVTLVTDPNARYVSLFKQAHFSFSSSYNPYVILNHPTHTTYISINPSITSYFKQETSEFLITHESHFFHQNQNLQFAHSMARQERPTPDLSNIKFREGEVGEWQRDNYLRFYQCSVQPTRYVENDCLTELGLSNGVEWMLNTSGLTQPCTNRQPTYEALTLEFLSLFSYITPLGATQFLTGAATFRMFDTEYSLNQTQIAWILGFRHRDRVHCYIPGGWPEIAFGVWHNLTNVNFTSWDAVNATYIHNPSIRYFHRVLGHTVFGRVNNHKVNSKELFFLHCVHSGGVQCHHVLVGQHPSCLHERKHGVLFWRNHHIHSIKPEPGG